MSLRRVVITGTGIISPLGDSRQSFHHSLCQGHSGLKRAALFADPRLEDPLVGEIEAFSPADYLGQRNFRPLDRTSQLLACAAQLGLDDSGWSETIRNRQPIGLVVGTTFCSVHTISQFDCRAQREGPSYASPLDFANTVINAAAGQTAIWHKLTGVNSTISTGITSGLDAITYAADLIQHGHEKAILAGGVEELCVESLLAFQQAGLLRQARENETTCETPADHRAVLAMAEGAALVMLEDYEHAVAREANLLAEIKGHSACFDGSATESPSGHRERTSCVARSIRQAIGDAQLDHEAIDFVSLSANGVRQHDSCEMDALRQVFCPQFDRLSMSAPKTLMGESLGASAAMQTVEMIESLCTGVPTGLQRVERAGAPEQARDSSTSSSFVEAQFGLVHSMSLEGNCSSLVIGSPPSIQSAV